MARLRSPERRRAILEAAVVEIAEAGLAAPTARIAARAGVAEGTLFTYFPTKGELLNELYAELKAQVHGCIREQFPQRASAERKAWHVWSCSLAWSMEFPLKRKASMQLQVSDTITAETRTRSAEGQGPVDALFVELDGREALRGLPRGFAACLMDAVQDATMEMTAKGPRQRKALVERGFAVFWRAVR